MRVDPGVLGNNPEDRRFLIGVVSRALEAADPARAVARAVTRSGSVLELAGTSVDLDEVERFLVLALGKAASAMASGLLPSLESAEIEGLVVGPQGSEPVDGLDHVVGGHPIPNEASLAGGRRLLELAAEARPGDLIIVLLSGGGSALAEALVPGVTLDDLTKLNRLLLSSGATIEEINAVRRRLSKLKGGGLAAAARRSRLVTLVISDVVGNVLSAIASGPTVADPTSTGDARAVLHRYGLAGAVSPSVIEALRRPRRAAAVPRHQAIEVILDGRDAASAAVKAARDVGRPARIAETPLTGEARAVGARLARSSFPPGLTAHWGETTVTVTGQGRGGRNQELALAAAMGLDDEGQTSIVALATDGVDGPTDAAGAIVDGKTVERGRRAGLEALDHLARNDAYPFLKAAGDLLVTGPTGTNVGDLVLVWRGKGVPPG